MSVTVLVGAQFGDEGKGKIVDYLAKDMDMVVRFQGGDNAGHTVVNDKGSFKLHLVPCGIFEDGCKALANTGMVINPDELMKELAEIEKGGVDTSLMYISSRAVILMPYHIALDSASERSGRTGIGTTKRGIGYAYADRARRNALRFENLLDLEYCRKRVEAIMPTVNAELEAKGCETFSVEDIMAKISVWAEKLSKRIVEPVSFVNKAIARGEKLLFEGQLGAMKDIDLGIYPYVTSSNPVAAYAAVSGGFPVSKIDEIVGVMKAFSSAVGDGPFPTEMNDEQSDGFRGTGNQIDDEFGARTGRARRLGWLDLPIVKFAATVNGFTSIAVCKIDKLDTYEKIKVCTGYKLNGELIDYMPSATDLYKVEPVYEEMEGWLTSTREIRDYDALPVNAKKYIELIEKHAGVPVKYIGVGPAHDEIIVR
ncbi:MAG: adenylosuccinate synthase [Firmicutes bacterium]|uniref:Adenylosuccinate synthetase n=1 Tax=Candidatus Stercoripulliclostridium pullicola TaxID=2840953 RepID=A0A940ICZ1_9FIRM|nr:adenylosuccinate synthase [Candidatus Stercoripulliclostridium pullicola]